MKKLFVVAAALVLGIAVVTVFVMPTLDRMIISAVEDYGRASTGTEVRLRGADVSLSERIGILSGLTIGNPPGFQSDHALRLDEIRLDIDLASLRGDVLVVNAVTVNGAHLNAEQRGRSINLIEIQNHMARAAEAPPVEEERRIIIDRFRLTNASMTLISEALDEQTMLELADVSVDAIGRDADGATYEEATQALLGPILASARAAAEQRLRDAARREVEDEVRERLRDLLDRN